MRSKRGRFAQLIHAVYCEPWLVRPEMHATIADVLEAHITGAAHEAGGIAALFEADEPADPYTVRDGVAVVPVNGIIGKRVSEMEKACGVADVDDLTAALQAAAEDGAASGIVLDINSPGGSVTGVPELAALVREIDGGSKRVVSFTDTMAASAVYWIGSQAGAFIASPSASVGSVGVYLALLDASRAYDAAGLRREVIKAGKLKGMGIEGTSLTDDQRAHLQASVDALHAQFKAAVRGRRGNVADDAMEGQDFYAAEAKGFGLIDDCGTLADAMRLAVM